MYYLQKIKNFKSLKSAIDNYIIYYNSKRYQKIKMYDTTRF